MDKKVLVHYIYGEVDFNPACFDMPEEEAIIKKLWRDPRPIPTEEQFLNAQKEYEKLAKPDILYKEMVKDIYAEMEKVFGTRNDVSAAAFASTYEAMTIRPENYIDPELGLNNAAEVLAFAQSKLSAIDAYGVFRLKRINKFKADVAAL